MSWLSVDDPYYPSSLQTRLLTELSALAYYNPIFFDISAVVTSRFLRYRDIRQRASNQPLCLRFRSGDGAGTYQPTLGRDPEDAKVSTAAAVDIRSCELSEYTDALWYSATMEMRHNDPPLPPLLAPPPCPPAAVVRRAIAGSSISNPSPGFACCWSYVTGPPLVGQMANNFAEFAEGGRERRTMLELAEILPRPGGLQGGL
ncbi:hypothetical protein F5Y14DRAFT_459233 [Nemania sp. NC0429]|nr:hypothetical protein F5Y14DRAFT_459233 [Nemania sp. NC0429]